MKTVEPVWAEAITAPHLLKMFPGYPQVVSPLTWLGILKTGFWDCATTNTCPNHIGHQSCLINHSRKICLNCSLAQPHPDYRILVFAEWKYKFLFHGPSQWICALLTGDLYNQPTPNTINELKQFGHETFNQRAFGCYLAFQDCPETAMICGYIKPDEQYDWCAYVDWRLENNDVVPEWAQPFPLFLETCRLNSKD